jgi:hypothetical protein
MDANSVGEVALEFLHTPLRKRFRSRSICFYCDGDVCTEFRAFLYNSRIENDFKYQWLDLPAFLIYSSSIDIAKYKWITPDTTKVGPSRLWWDTFGSLVQTMDELRKGEREHDTALRDERPSNCECARSKK